MAERCWWVERAGNKGTMQRCSWIRDSGLEIRDGGRRRRMRKAWAVGLVGVVLAAPLGLRAQATDGKPADAQPAVDPAADKNATKARATLDAMVKALGGDAWLNVKNMVREGHMAAFHR